MNKGIKLASGDIVGILNSDDIYSDEKVLHNVAKFHRYNNIEVSLGNITQITSSGKIIRKYSGKTWSPEKLKFAKKDGVKKSKNTTHRRMSLKN